MWFEASIPLMSEMESGTTWKAEMVSPGLNKRKVTTGEMGGGFFLRNGILAQAEMLNITRYQFIVLHAFFL